VFNCFYNTVRDFCTPIVNPLFHKLINDLHFYVVSLESNGYIHFLSKFITCNCFGEFSVISHSITVILLAKFLNLNFHATTSNKCISIISNNNFYSKIAIHHSLKKLLQLFVNTTTYRDWSCLEFEIAYNV